MVTMYKKYLIVHNELLHARCQNKKLFRMRIENLKNRGYVFRWKKKCRHTTNKEHTSPIADFRFSRPNSLRKRTMAFIAQNYCKLVLLF